MNGADLVALLRPTLTTWTGSAEELRDLDAAIGDGDLGITVTKGAAAVAAKLDALPADPTPAEVLRAAGAGFAGGNPSTMAALVGGALLAGAKAVKDLPALARADLVLFADAAVEAVMTRGKAALGDKTMLDAVVPSLEALKAAEPAEDPLPEMIDAATAAVATSAQWQSRRGRAAWVGERSVGHPDPGATAYLRLLEALAAAQGQTSTRPDNPDRELS